MGETEDLVRLRQLNLELLQQLWAGQEAVRRAVAQAASEPSLDSSSSHDLETLSSRETRSTSLRTSSLEESHPGDPRAVSWPGGPSSGGPALPSGGWRWRGEPLYRPRACSAPSVTTSGSSESQLSPEQDSSGPQEAPALRPSLAQRGSLPKPRVTFHKDPPVPEENWRLRPYLGYDWIAGSLDSSSPVTSKSETFFSKLRNFRDANQEECVCSDRGSPLLGLHEKGDVPEDHECVYCYRVNRRLFLVPSDPGAPCRLCGMPRGQRGPETLVDPAQVRVSVPLSILDPPHRHRIHRRKSFDASDTLALPRHCLLGWDVFPPKPEKSSAPRSLDLWSCVASEAQRRKPSAASPRCSTLPAQVPPPVPVWSGPPAPRPKP